LRTIILTFLCSVSTFILWGQDCYWVTFKDKGTSYSLDNPSTFLSPQALSRRLYFNIPVQVSDLPVSQTYLNAVVDLGAQNGKSSKWLNGAFFYSSDPSFVNKVSQLSFIESVLNLSTNFQKSVNNKLDLNAESLGNEIPIETYGFSYKPIKMLEGQFLHNLGFKANTIDIAVMDNGFQFVNTNPYFDSLNTLNKITGVYNYVENTTNVFSEGTHGASVMSILAANKPDTLLGSAPLGNYYLFTTENNNAEGKAEEISWALAAEWADSALGTWVVLSTSLGYSAGFSDPSTNYSYNDMDGNTTIITKAADLAAQKGLLVVNSAGNEGEDSWKFITAPADGDSVLAIGAVDSFTVVTKFSSYGPAADGDLKPNVSAQGRSVVAVRSDGELERISGTSFSCPLVAGLAACLWEAFPQKNNMEIIQAIEQSAHLYYTPDPQMGYGLPNFKIAYEILSKDLNEVSNSLWVYPNPVQDQFSLSFLSADKQGYELLIADVNGKVFIKEKNKSNTTEMLVDVSALEKGVYWVFVKQGKQKFSKKILKI
jgi:subtilisin family serine protease